MFYHLKTKGSFMRFDVKLRERIPELIALSAKNRRGYMQKALAAAVKKTQQGLRAEITQIIKRETALGESKIRKRIKRHKLVKRDNKTVAGTTEITGISMGLSDYPKRRMTFSAERVKKRRVKRKSGRWVNTSKKRLKGARVKIKPSGGFVPLSKKMFPLKAKSGSKWYIATRDPETGKITFPRSTSPVDVFAENRGEHRERILEKARVRFSKEVDQFLYADMRGFVRRQRNRRTR